MNDDDIKDTLRRVTPELDVPVGLVGGARRRRRRTRGLAAGGAVAVVAMLIVPVGLNLGGGEPVAEPASAPMTEVVAEMAESPSPSVSVDAAVETAAEEAAEGLGKSGRTALAAQRSQELGWEVIQAGDGANRVVSPSSLSMSLVQVAEGAEGASLASIDGVLGLSGATRAETFSALREALLPYDSLPESVSAGDPPETPVVHQASRVLAIDAELNDEFLKRTEQYYGSRSESSTFDEAKANLDAWAQLHTAGLIKKSAIELTPDVVAVLQDAVLFAAAWEQPFTEAKGIAFKGPDGNVSLEGMYAPLLVRYAHGERWTAVRLPYDENLAADVILPREGMLPMDLTAAELDQARVALDATLPRPVAVTMPAIDLSVSNDLVRALPGIDLDNLDGIFEGGSVKQWVQQVTLTIGAEGTVGAALTELSVQWSAAEPQAEFTVDRPYVFRVLDTRTGWPLFLAAISDPSEES